MAPSPPLQSSGTVTLSPWRQKEPDSDSSRTQWKVSNSTITSELSFRICNVPWMELFIWSCSTEANHCIKTSSRVTCGSYLSLQLPDTFPPNHTCRKQRITFHSGVSSSHVVIPYWLQRLVVVTARRHCWKWHWQIITHQCVWQCQHIWLAQTRRHAKPDIFLLLPCGALRWLISDPVSSPSQLNFEVQCKAIHTTPLKQEGLLQIPLIHKTLPAVSIALFIYTAYSSAYTHLCMWPHLPRLLRQVSARVLKGESSHLCAKRKMCSTGEAMLFSPSVNMLINGTVSLSTPHLLKCFTWCLAQVLHAALPFHHFHTNLEWPSLCPFSSAPENTCIQTHTDWIVDDFAATRGKWLETSQC